MTPRRRQTSPVLTEQLMGDALGEILRKGGVSPLPELRPGFRSVQLDRIVVGSDLQTRAAFDPERDREDAELVQSVRDVGVRQPVHLLDQGDGTYAIRSGHRRVSAARIAGQPSVLAIVWPAGTDHFDSALDTWLENLHRKDLAPLERGRMLAQLLQRFDLPRSADSARKLGLSKTSFYRYLSLLDAPDDVQEALADGDLGLVQAEKLAAVDDPELRRRLIQVAGAGTAPARIEDALRRHREGVSAGDDVLDGGRPSDHAESPGREQSWASRKSRELGRALGLKAASLGPITKGLNARRISAAHAAAASLLVASGDEAEAAIETAAQLDRNSLRSLEALFRAVFVAPAGPRNPVARQGLQRILRHIAALLEEEGAHG